MLGLENDWDEFIEAVLAQLASAHVKLLQSLCASVNPRQLLYSIPEQTSLRGKLSFIMVQLALVGDYEGVI